MMGFDRETAFQCWMICGFALNFAAMAIVLDRFRFGWLAVSLGAAVFSFLPPSKYSTSATSRSCIECPFR